MDLSEAGSLVDEYLTRLRALPYEELRRRAEDEIVNTSETIGASGIRYQFEVQAFWDDRQKRNIRVLVSIDDGGLRAFRPLTKDFIKAPDGSFVGESNA
jgi:hypothetical protein